MLLAGSSLASRLSHRASIRKYSGAPPAAGGRLRSRIRRFQPIIFGCPDRGVELRGTRDLVALLLGVTLAAGCGSSRPSASAPTLESSVAADPPKTPPVAGGASPDAARGPSTPSPSAAGAPTGPQTRRPIPPAHPVPAAFRPAPGAQSDAEVRSELAQLDAIPRRGTPAGAECGRCQLSRTAAVVYRAQVGNPGKRGIGVP